LQISGTVKCNFSMLHEAKSAKMSSTNGSQYGMRYVQSGHQTSVEVGSDSMNTLYSLLLIAGPILRSVSAPFLLADFCGLSENRSFHYLMTELGNIPVSFPINLVHGAETLRPGRRHLDTRMQCHKR